MNSHIAQVVDELYELGIEDIVLSPGARSTPLAVLFCEHSFNIYMDIDERSAAFFALGMAKAKSRAVVLVCTSGSACGHYLPAIMEAKHSKIPLIILTADRPPELQNVGAPQTVNQNNIFANFVKYYEEISISSDADKAQAKYARLVMQKAYVQTHTSPCAAVHINVPLREPLLPLMDKLDFSLARAKKPFTFMAGVVENKNFVDYFMTHCLGKKGIIVCGPAKVHEDRAYYEDMLSLAEALQAPILADPLSQFRAYGHENIITSYDAFLKSDQVVSALKADYILLIGQSPVSKSFFNFLKTHEQAEVFQLNNSTEYINPALNTSKIIQVSEWSFAKAILQDAPQKNIDEAKIYLNTWQNWQQKMWLRLNLAKEASEMFEGRIIIEMQDTISNYINNHSQAGLQLIIANSMAIRHMDHFWQSKQQHIYFYGNRGVNGIDGTISTALGIAAAVKTNSNKYNAQYDVTKPTVLITGDLALFHDLSGLLVGCTHKIDLTIVLLNNKGGGIFQYLPQAKLQNFEYLFLTPHNLDFSALAKLYNLSHYQISTYEEFNTIFENSLHSTGIKIIEVPIHMQTSKSLHIKCQQLI